MSELWQLYDEQAKPLDGQGAPKEDVFSKGLLHGASHVWIWRKKRGTLEVMLQRRASGKRTWPDCLDISAAGHIDLGESPETAALREAEEEIGLTIDPSKLFFLDRFRAHLEAGENLIENEHQFLYLLRTDQEDFKSDGVEVNSTEWRALDVFEVQTLVDNSSEYVPHGNEYYELVIRGIRKVSAG